jgi:hypothetical protein
MRLSRQGWAVVAAVSRAVAERAITEREGCVEIFGRLGGDPGHLVRAVRAGVRLFEGRARGPRHAAGLAREVRRLREAQPGAAAPGATGPSGWGRRASPRRTG